MSHGAILDNLNWRYAVRKFDPEKKISSKDFGVIEEVLRLTPSSYGLQPWKFIVVESPAVREELRAASWNQGQVTDASHFVVLAYKKKVEEKDVEDYLNFIASTRELELDTLAGFRKSIMGDVVSGPRSKIVEEWASRQLYIAMGFVLAVAANMKIDACPMEGINPLRYDEILGLKDSGYKSCLAIAFGYRHGDCRLQRLKKVRFPKSQVFKYI